MSNKEYNNIYLNYKKNIARYNGLNQRQIPLLSQISFQRIVGLIIRGGTFEKIFRQGGINFDHFKIILDYLESINLIQIKKFGFISSLKKGNKLLRVPNFKLLSDDIKYDWKFELNQYPCTNLARKDRIKIYCEYFALDYPVHIAVLGDGDRTSLAMSSQSNTKVTVFEKDIDLINTISKVVDAHNLPVKFIKHDLQEPLGDYINKYDCFFCDPPYTLNGLKCWIYRGFELMKVGIPTLGFIFFTNDMLQQNWKEELLSFLASLDGRLVEFERSFNSYKHPKHYQQYQRAKKFAEKYNISSKRFENWGAWSNLLIIEFNKKDGKTSNKKFNNIYYFKK